PYRERVFGIFERLGDGGASTAGTGIGLAFCRKIVEMTGGTIRVGDAEVGTRVEMLFPRSAVAAPPESEPGR
ncbi:MAG: ATP-binding protein, partial [Actinomycetota bacterium]|nr:ATP-binding protein [Actinomycetota bacterium]